MTPYSFVVVKVLCYIHLFSSPGNGVDIYVFSTGIDYKHEEFGGRAFYGGYDKYGYSGIDCDGQGTAVASLAVGKTVGVAKKARVYR